MAEKEIDGKADQESHIGSEMSLIDYIEEQSQLEEEARESLPYSFDHCTRDRRLRQPLYVCKTCFPANGERQRGGICYSCSIQCHGDHEIIELFCKRDFRCDCGTDRLGTEICKIRKERSPVDPDNQYNHNFEGRFCWCDTDYDATTDERTMFQCLLCEDWFHDECIGMENIKNSDDYDLFICRSCVKKESWLKRYLYVKGFACNKKKEVSYQNERESILNTVSDANEEISVLNSDKNMKRKLDDEESLEMSPKKVKTENNNEQSCSWAILPMGPEEDISLFLTNDFRLGICHCVQCLALMAKNPVLLAEEETYEPPEDSDGESLIDAGVRALNSLPRVQVIESIIAYNYMKNALSKFLRPYAEEGKVVTEDAIREFFDRQMEEKKMSNILSKTYKDTSF
ncbi:hypothetical protein T552_01358 [Pneumocystis carinii B80]|uniref:UBR-type domain-containing protein n=1 Tax=Pneumocystis carinii (strain B80) TaxID=1408658 RepID=A0A0W4ZM15_PNEC8|nr:hypothetical protein T552_01358 [Pneumocystis carinii B80]KTW29406.1 hypothetical protein T552_01358 [Pneumocystis carinii B80]